MLEAGRSGGAGLSTVGRAGSHRDVGSLLEPQHRARLTTMSTDEHPVIEDLRTIRAAGVAGLLFAGLLTVSLVLMRLDPLGAEGVSSYCIVRVGYMGLLALYPIPFAGIPFLL